MEIKKSMRKTYLVFFFILAFSMFLFSACGGGGGGGGQSAGVKDGAIELADARLDFGANAISDSSKSTLTVIKLSDSDHEMVDGINSDLFELYLEEDLDQPVTVTIPMKNTEKPEGDDIGPALGIGQIVTSKTGSTNTLYAFIPAEIDGSNIVATFIPSEYMAEITVNGANGEARPSKERIRFGLFWFQTFFEDGGHFLVDFPVGNLKKDGFLLDYKTRPEFLKDLEEVYETYLSKGFTYSKRKNWPMKVTIQSLDAEGYYSGSYWAPAEGSISINRKFFAGGYKANQVKPLLAHEFFHFVQANYMDDAGDLLWLDEATATYFEGEKAGKLPTIVSEYKEKIFGGVFPIENTAGQGYARMSLIKFLVGKVGEEGIKNVYTMAGDGASWDDALLSSFGPRTNWAPVFYEALVKGEIGDYAPFTLHSNLAKGGLPEVGTSVKLEIPSPDKVKQMLENDESPLLGSATLNIEAFGAQLVAFTIDEKNLKNLEDDMNPVVSVGDGHLTLLSIKGRDFNVMSGGSMENFKKATADKVVFLAIVTGLHESGKKSYEVKAEFPAAPTLDELVGEYKDGSLYLKEVYIADRLLQANNDDDEDGIGCDLGILEMIKAMEGQTLKAVLRVAKTGEDRGTFDFYVIDEDGDSDEDEGLDDPIKFTYAGGKMIFDTYIDEDTISQGIINAAYGKNKDVTLNGEVRLSDKNGDAHIDVVFKGTKPL